MIRPLRIRFPRRESIVILRRSPRTLRLLQNYTPVSSTRARNGPSWSRKHGQSQEKELCSLAMFKTNMSHIEEVSQMVFRKLNTSSIARVLRLTIIMGLIGIGASWPTASVWHDSHSGQDHPAKSPSKEEKAKSDYPKAANQPASPWKEDQLINPEELAKWLSRSDKPLVLYVGPPSLYRRAHIPGSRLVGPGSTPEGLETLRKTVQEHPTHQSVVLYCGCCPLKDCPNIGPAFNALQKLQVKKPMALYLANSFTKDWVKKDFPIEKEEEVGESDQ